MARLWHDSNADFVRSIWSVTFERFSSRFNVEPSAAEDTWRDETLMSVKGYRELMARFAGCSFDGGLYRLHSAATGLVGQELAAATFPEFADRARVFGFDWLGRQAAIDSARMVDGEPQVLLLEPGTGEALEIPVGFVSFHDEEIVDHRDAALASEFFAQWCESNPSSAPLSASQCVGYKIPLFLSGQDTIDNLELTDFEAYWDLAGQLRRRTRGLPDGTKIRGGTIEE